MRGHSYGEDALYFDRCSFQVDGCPHGNFPDRLRSTFIIATLCLPEVLVIDNGTTFTSEDFEHFCTWNGIRHLRSSPYHRTNGLAKLAVQTFKHGFKKLIDRVFTGDTVGTFIVQLSDNATDNNVPVTC